MDNMYAGITSVSEMEARDQPPLAAAMVVLEKHISEAAERVQHLGSQLGPLRRDWGAGEPPSTGSLNQLARNTPPSIRSKIVERVEELSAQVVALNAHLMRIQNNLDI